MGTVEAKGLLDAPERPSNIPENAQWVGGVGAGSWFSIHQGESMGKFQYRIQRFAPNGEMECDGLFYLEDKIIHLKNPYAFTYLSHCGMCTILQSGRRYTLEAIHTRIA